MYKKEIRKLPSRPRAVRAIGFDDAPFSRRRGARVWVTGAVCSGTRFEGMLWGGIRKDGWGATDTLCHMLRASKYLPQIHVVLIDGIALGGLNLVDLPRLAEAVDRPCIAVMRRVPDLAAMERAIRALPRPDQRLRILRRAGPIHRRPPFVFQVQGATADAAHDALERLTDRGHVPEALRLAHLIGSAVVDGQSRGRA